MARDIVRSRATTGNREEFKVDVPSPTLIIEESVCKLGKSGMGCEIGVCDSMPTARIASGGPLIVRTVDKSRLILIDKEEGSTISEEILGRAIAGDDVDVSGCLLVLYASVAMGMHTTMRRLRRTPTPTIGLAVHRMMDAAINYVAAREVVRRELRLRVCGAHEAGETVTLHQQYPMRGGIAVREESPAAMRIHASQTLPKSLVVLLSFCRKSSTIAMNVDPFAS